MLAASQPDMAAFQNQPVTQVLQRLPQEQYASLGVASPFSNDCSHNRQLCLAFCKAMIAWDMLGGAVLGGAAHIASWCILSR